MSLTGLYELMSWMSPSYPVGAYTYSHGVEYAVEAGFIRDLKSLTPWLQDVLHHGGARNDAILCAETHRAATNGDNDKLRELLELGYALRPTKELDLETTAQGRAFMSVTSEVFRSETSSFLKEAAVCPIVYPIAMSAAAADRGIPLNATVEAYLHGFVSNLVSAAVRIIPLGQTDGQRAIAALADDVEAQVQETLKLTIADIGSATMMVDWCSAQHETQYTRLFRS
ncbi:MAG: urease accessory protein UreF [Sneathiella sp.]|nr:urease accessory protein UreF [Sneathiella sp.]